MPEQPTIQIPLDLPDVRVLRTELTPDRELMIAANRGVPEDAEEGGDSDTGSGGQPGDAAHKRGSAS